MAYYEDFARIHFLNNARKRAKRDALHAQLVYEECCSALAKEKSKVESFFRALSDDDDVNSEQE